MLHHLGLRHGRLRRIPLTLLGAAAISLGAAGVAHAATATFTVDSTTDAPLKTSTATTCVSSDSAGNCTLRAAVQAADNLGGSSTITLPAGAYKYTIAATSADDPANGDLDVTNTSSITLTGAGSGTTTIDANNLDRAFSIDAGSSLSLSGITIENGSPSGNSTAGNPYGGAIYDAGGLTVTKDVVFRGDSAGGYGGAIYAAAGSSLSLNGATFDGENAGGSGSAIDDDTTQPVSISNSIFERNSGAESGAGIYAGGGNMTITDTTFDDNAAEEYGGGIYWDAPSSTLTVSHSTFSGDNADYVGGGAVYDDASAGMTLTDDLFSDDSAGYLGGGALYLDSSASYVLSGDEFDRDTGGEEGGAIAWYKGALDVDTSSFLDDLGGYDGGALYADAGASYSLTLDDSTLADNDAEYGGGIDFDQTTPVSMDDDTIAFNTSGYGDSDAVGGGIAETNNATTSGYTAPSGGSETAGIENTMIAENYSGDCTEYQTFSSAVDLGHNLDSDGSCFSSGSGNKVDASPDLAQPADNGGPVAGNPNGTTETLQTVAELAGSPSIGAGSGCTATDERGVSRSTTCDIGAYQAEPAALAVTGSGPASAKENAPYEDTFTITDKGPAPATGTTLALTLPSRTTAYAASGAGGTCTASGSKIDCPVGVVSDGSSAKVTILLATAKAETAIEAATVTDSEAASTTAKATTKVVATRLSGTKPSAKTGKATKITRSSAKLSGTFKVGSQTTYVFFQFGRRKSLGESSRLVKKTKNGTVTLTLRDLKGGATYHYRLAAVNTSGVSYGRLRTLRTAR